MHHREQNQMQIMQNISKKFPGDTCPDSTIVTSGHKGNVAVHREQETG